MAEEDWAGELENLAGLLFKLLILKVGERGRNRTFNLLIKSHPRSVGQNLGSHV